MNKNNIVSDYDLWFKYTENIKMHNINYRKIDFIQNKSENLLDLHGLTIEKSYKATEEFLYCSKQKNKNKVIVITGKSGTIRKEFPFWMENFKEKKLIQNFKELNSGSFIIKLSKKY